jgi:hypothetical protein
MSLMALLIILGKQVTLSSAFLCSWGTSHFRRPAFAPFSSTLASSCGPACMLPATCRLVPRQLGASWPARLVLGSRCISCFKPFLVASVPCVVLDRPHQSSAACRVLHISFCLTALACLLSSDECFPFAFKALTRTQTTACIGSSRWRSRPMSRTGAAWDSCACMALWAWL